MLRFGPDSSNSAGLAVCSSPWPILALPAQGPQGLNLLLGFARNLHAIHTFLPLYAGCTGP